MADSLKLKNLIPEKVLSVVGNSRKNDNGEKNDEEKNDSEKKSAPSRKMSGGFQEQLKRGWGIIWKIISFFMYPGDFFFDLWVALEHFNSGRTIFGIFTAVFTFLPGVITAIYSAISFATSEKGKTAERREKVIRTIFDALLMSRFYRRVRTVIIDIQHWRAGRANDQEKMEELEEQKEAEEEECSVIDLFDRYLEAAPQLVLQLIFVIQQLYQPDGETSVTEEAWKCGTSLFTLAAGLAAFEPSAQAPGLNVVSRAGEFFRTIWIFCILAARVWALSLFASASPAYLYIMLGLCLSHWLLACLYFYWRKRQQERAEATPTPAKPETPKDSQQALTPEKEEEDQPPGWLTGVPKLITMTIFASLHIFVAFNPLEETPGVNKIFYPICLLENGVLIALGLMYYKANHWASLAHSTIVILTAVSVGIFFVGIIVMLMYYGCCQACSKVGGFACLNRCCCCCDGGDEEEGKEEDGGGCKFCCFC